MDPAQSSQIGKISGLVARRSSGASGEPGGARSSLEELGGALWIPEEPGGERGAWRTLEGPEEPGAWSLVALAV